MKDRKNLLLKLNMIMFFAPLAYTPAAVLGYMSILLFDDILWAWSIGITSVVTLWYISVILTILYMEHKERKEEEANGKK